MYGSCMFDHDSQCLHDCDGCINFYDDSLPVYKACEECGECFLSDQLEKIYGDWLCVECAEALRMEEESA